MYALVVHTLSRGTEATASCTAFDFAINSSANRIIRDGERLICKLQPLSSGKKLSQIQN